MASLRQDCGICANNMLSWTAIPPDLRNRKESGDANPYDAPPLHTDRAARSFCPDSCHGRFTQRSKRRLRITTRASPSSLPRKRFLYLDPAIYPLSATRRCCWSSTGNIARSTHSSGRTNSRCWRPLARRQKAGCRTVGAAAWITDSPQGEYRHGKAPTSAGTPALKDFRPNADAPVAAKLFSAGAIMLGKTNMHELAYGITNNNGAFGVVHNPYSPLLIPGGSSGGNGAAIAARLCAAGIGTDTGGSVRIPAFYARSSPSSALRSMKTRVGWWI